MLRHLLLAIALVLTSSLLVFSQTGSGTLKGTIKDKKTGEPIPFANIVVEVGGVQVGGSTTDMDGNYMIKPIPPGKVDLKATYVGYTPFIMKGIVIYAEKIQFQNVELQAQSVNLKEVEIVEYKVPLISKDQTVSGGTVDAEDIAKMANKSADAVAATVGGVGTDANGGITSMRGQRSTGTVYYIDGIRVIGSNVLPQSSIEQVEVILGGTPASYGDATGGIISVTTKGPSREISAGVDVQTSEFLDRFGYNRVGLNLTGPLFSKKDTVTKTKTPIMGYFLAGEFVYQKDGAPAATEYYKVQDDVLNNIRYNPIRLSSNGKAILLSADFLTTSDLQKAKVSQNTPVYNINASGKLDFRLTPTINMSFGGTLQFNDNYGFSYYGSLADYMYNTHNTSNTWRVNGRFTQRFPTANDSKSFVKNVYYSIGADFSRTDGKSEDAQLKEDLFKYGYIGSFATQSVRAYTSTLQKDSVTGKYAHLQNGIRDTGVIFTANNYNAESVAWVDEYFKLLPKVGSDGTGYYLNTDNIVGNNGLINGNQPQNIYGMWANVGTRGVGTSPYSFEYSEADQFNVQASFAGDFGHHEIQVGLQYQQRKVSSYGADGADMWSLMKLETNSQIAELDASNPQLVYRDGVFMDTINYYRKYSSTLQKNFDINLRQKLGLPVDGTDYIDINSYNYDAGTINYYDKNEKLHTVKVGSNLLNINMFTPDELFEGGSPLVSYAGYDYTGKKLTSRPTLDDFFNATDANGNYTREVAAFEPIYMAGYIQDKFAFKDLIFNVGLRVDRFDANQMVLKDPYLFFPAKTKGELDPHVWGNLPSNMGNDYVVYVDDPANPSTITGYRSGNQWYDKNGTPVSSPTIVDPTGVKPYLENASNTTMSTNVFKQYDPQVNYMPRISFSFPISDDALFYAHYDILTQRPSSGYDQLNPIAYYFINVTGSSGGTITNPDLKPEKTIDYELGFQQKINNASSLKLSVFYRDMQDQIQQFRLSGAWPKTYYSYTNIDFGTVKGLTVSYDLRRTGNARVRFSYTLQFADGTGSDANAAATIIRSDQPNLRTTNPLNFDRRHSFNAEFDYRWGIGKDYNGPEIKRKGKSPVQIFSNLGANLTLTGGSGTPYTRSSQVMQYGQMGPILGSINGSRLPWQFLLNLKVDKEFELIMGSKKKKPASLDVYLEVLNLLNTMNVVGVYPATGSSKDDGYLSAPEYQSQINEQVSPAAYRDLYTVYINKPYNYSSPRQTRLGVMFNF